MERGNRQRRKTRGLVLVVVLVMIVLLALLAAAYAFMVRAHTRTVQASVHTMKAKFAADAAFQRAITVLRESAGDVQAWIDNPDAFRGYPVYGGDEEKDTRRDNSSDVRTYDPLAEEGWRYSAVHPNYDDRSTVKYGFVDEGSRLNINTATEAELRSMFERVIPLDPDYPVETAVLVDSLLDWRSSGAARPNGAKDAYYMGLTPPYKCKQSRFATVEELLLVRGFSGWVLFGEDYNRNGLLDPNEDDGDESFPPDNSDGSLYAGLAPFLTVWSREYNKSSDGRPRINLNMRDTQKLQELLEADFDTTISSYVMQVRSSGKAFNSVMNLIPAPPPPEEEEEFGEGGPQGEESDPTTQPGGEEPTSQPAEQSFGEKGTGFRQKTTDPNGPPGGSEKDEEQKGGFGESMEEQPQESEKEETRPQTAQPPTQGPATTQPSGQPSKKPVYANLTSEPPPGTYDDLHLILDRLTVAPTPGMEGRINISTAPREVLAALDVLTDEQLDALVNTRKDLEGEELKTPAWLLTHNVLDEYVFRGILDKLTTGAATFRIEAIGYADHVGVVRRISTVFEMRGPIAQVLYQRDLTPLGPAYNPYGEDRRGLADAAGQ